MWRGGDALAVEHKGRGYMAPEVSLVRDYAIVPVGLRA